MRQDSDNGKDQEKSEVFEKFEEATRRFMSVPKEDILEAESKEKERKAQERKEGG